ncbi:MAG: leucine-rich repeat protein [Candidatus Gracilibacteria bacterium]|nr:leucine-rich repeat protein [Candidatus Gracilibacteria bacterium]
MKTKNNICHSERSEESTAINLKKGRCGNKFSMTKYNGFTLVELIVVISILAILGTIAFVNLQGFSGSARDSDRITTLANLQKGLNLFQIKVGSYPTPDNQTGTGIVNGIVLSYVGIIGDNISRIINYSQIPTDPLSQTNYVYGTDVNRTNYQIATTLENQIAYTPVIETTYANAGYKAKVVGNYNGLLKVGTGLYNLPSLIFIGTGIISIDTFTGFIIDKGTNLPYKLNTTDPENKETITKQLQQLNQTTATLVLTGVSIPNYTSSEFKGLLEIPPGLLSLGITNKDKLGQAIYGDNYFTTINNEITCADKQTPTAEQYFTFDALTQTITNYDATGGTDIVIPCKIGGVTVKTLGIQSFKNKGLTSVIIPDSVITIVNQAFMSNSLTEVIIPNGVTTIMGAAFHTNSLTSVVIPSNIISIANNTFFNNPLTSITNYDGFTSSEYFYTATGAGIEINGYIGTATNLTIPSTINGKSVVSLGVNAFNNKGLTNVVIPTSIISIGAYAFNNNPITNITNYDGVVSTEYIYGPSGAGIEIINYIGTATDLTIPSTINGKSVVSLGMYSFYNKGLTSVAIPNTVTNIGNSAFYGDLLTSVVIPDSVTNIGNYAFFTNQLSSITIGNSVTDIGWYAFYSNKLTSVVIPNSVINIGKEAFYNNLISSLTLGNSIKTIEIGAFYVNSLTNVAIPNSITSIGGYAFHNNPLTSVTNYDGVVSTEYVYGPSGNGIEISSYMGAATNLTIPGSINGKNVISLGVNAFGGKGLTSVVIPMGITTIGLSAFYNNGLTAITIPSSVTSIGTNAFSNQNTSVGNGTVYGPASGYVFDTYANNTNTEFDKVKLPNYVGQ